MTKRSVLFINGYNSPLHLGNIERTADGLDATVINGAWHLTIKGTTALALDGYGALRNQWEIVTMHEIEIPNRMPFGDDYNKAIKWAEHQLKEEASIHEAIRQGLEDVDAGRVRPVEDVVADLRKKHSIPSGICHCGLSMDEWDHGSPYHTPTDNPITEEK